VITATNRLGCTFRLGRNNIILYPPDGSPPYTVHARNSQRQVDSLKVWLAKHSADPDEPKPEELEQLANRVNNPDEHPPKARQEPQAAHQEPPSPSGEGTPAQPPPARPRAQEAGEWREYRTRDENRATGFETNGRLYRCIECLGTPTEYVADNPRGIGGHNRMNHRATDNLRTPEAQAKGLETRRLNRMTSQAAQAYEILGNALGIQAGVDVKALEQRIADLQVKVRVTEEQRDSEAAARADAEAKLALIREASGL
jgi:hypothetical protein